MTNPAEGTDPKQIEYLQEVQKCKDAHPDVNSPDRKACIDAQMEKYFPLP